MIKVQELCFKSNVLIDFILHLLSLSPQTQCAAVTVRKQGNKQILKTHSLSKQADTGAQMSNMLQTAGWDVCKSESGKNVEFLRRKICRNPVNQSAAEAACVVQTAKRNMSSEAGLMSASLCSAEPQVCSPSPWMDVAATAWQRRPHHGRDVEGVTHSSRPREVKEWWWHLQPSHLDRLSMKTFYLVQDVLSQRWMTWSSTSVVMMCDTNNSLQSDAK